MSLYVYAIADGPVAVENLRGVAGEPLQFVAGGDGKAFAIAGDFSGGGGDRSDSAGRDSGSGSGVGGVSPPALTAESLRAQDALVRELALRAAALLPARFGARFADERTLRQTLDDLAPRLDRALTRVRGREQMTIRLFHDSPSSPAADAAATQDDARDARDASRTGGADSAGSAGSASGATAAGGDAQLGPGTRYMRMRAAEGHRWPAAIEELRAALADAIDDERVERGQSPVIGSIHHLIPRGSADRYRARVEEAAAAARLAASGIRLRVSGPSPAYAFAEADLS